MTKIHSLVRGLTIGLLTVINFFPNLSYAQVPASGPPVVWKSVTWMRNQPSGFFNTVQENSGEDWWYSVAKMYNSNEEHIGYIAAGFSTFDDYTFEPQDECFEAEPSVECVDFQCTGLGLKGPAFQTIGLFTLDGKMYRCRTFNTNTFWDVQQSLDRQSIIAVGETKSPYDFTNEDWEGASSNYLIYNPSSTNNPSSSPKTFSSCEGFDPADDPQKKMNVIKMDMLLNVEWNYIYGEEAYVSTGESAYDRASIGYSIVPLETSSGEKYRIVGMAQSTYLKNNAFVIDIDEDGYLNWSDTPLGASDYRSTLLNVIKGTDNVTYMVGHLYNLTSGTSSGILVLSYDDNDAYDWQKVITNSEHNVIHDSKFNGAYSVDIDYQGNLLVGALVNSTYYASSTAYDPLDGHEALATGIIYTIEPSSGSTVTHARDPISIGEVKAFDLKIGVTATTSDNGFAVVSTKTPRNAPGPDFWDYESFTEEYVGVLSCYGIDGCGTNSYNFHCYDSDAYVAKYVDDAGEWAQKWEKTVSTDGERGPWPGQIKMQECVYKIIESGDNGLVVAGNTSHNHDDNYLFKIAQDCELENVYLEFPNEYNSSDWVETSSNVFVLQNNATISSDESFKGTMVIPDGKTLTIDDATIQFGDSRKLGFPTYILVRRGGKLVIDNGSVLKASTECESTMWDGIIVLGNIKSGTIAHQGIVEINQNCTIQDAHVGVLAGGPWDDKYKWQGGGIVRAEQATFLNNFRDVIFYPYDKSRTHPWFTESVLWASDFLCTAQLRDKHMAQYAKSGVIYETGTTAHITAWDIHGLEIVGNTIQGNTTLDPLVWSHGIVSLDATYDVDCAVTDIDGCVSAANTFDKLKFGVHAMATNAANAPNINGNTFTNISNTGIYMEGISSAYIINNDFTQTWGKAMYEVSEEIQDYACAQCNTDSRAVYLYNCNRYLVEGNVIDGNAPVMGGYIGTGIENYVTIPVLNNGVRNEVYRNEYNGLSFASFGNGFNRGLDQFGADGLDFRCGEYAANVYDILSMEGAVEGDGISAKQGFYDGSDPEDRTPAGNVFDGCEVTEGELYSQTEHYVYVHHENNGGNVYEPAGGCYDPGTGVTEQTLQSTTEEVSYADNCPMLYEYASRRAKSGNAYVEASDDYDVDLTAYLGAIDVGNTAGLIDHVTNDEDDNSVNTYYSLASPYLSDEAMLALIEDKPTPFDETMLIDILKDNSPLTEAVLYAANNRSPSISSGLLIDLAAEQSPGPSPRSLLEQALTYSASSKRLAKDEYIRALMHDYGDSISNRMDTILLLLAAESDTLSMCELASFYILNNQPISATSALSGVTDGSQWFEYASHLRNLIDFRTDSTNIDTLLRDTGLFNQAAQWADDETNTAWMAANGMMQFLHEWHVFEQPEENWVIDPVSFYPESAPAKKGVNEWAEKKQEELNAQGFAAYPNPFDAEIAFAVAGVDGSSVLVHDIRGQLVVRLPIAKDQRLVQWNVNNLPAGVYIAVLMEGESRQALRIVKY